VSARPASGFLAGTWSVTRPDGGAHVLLVEPLQELSAADAAAARSREPVFAKIRLMWLLTVCVVTNRRAEILRLIAQGLNNPEIAARLFVTTHTVKSHINRIFAKTGSRDRAAAIRYAREHALA
jgi:DNA-binding NarL/FixJ family response regulator